ncbi:hypothetical protein ACK8GG_10585 [Micromonosporaceae bacterium DT55]|uniref:hypothetical protein n=1 Tax=Melissospora conviva TaxID=3388432 RepID=UPI003C182890
MAAVQRDFRPGTDELIVKIDSYLAAARAGLREGDLALVERLVGCLHELVIQTSQASAADRAQVRAAVHYLVPRREAQRHLPLRSLANAQRVVNRVALNLGRPDLLVEPSAEHPVR